MNTRTTAFAALFALATAGMAARPQDLEPIQVSEQVRAQLSRIYEEKASRSPALKKLSTNLVYEVRELRRDAQMVGVPRMPAALEMRSGNLIQVDITAEVTPDLLAAIREVGGEVESSFPQYAAIRAWMPTDALETLADRAEVKRIVEAVRPMLNKINTSQGDVAHRANVARSVHGVNGSGVKVGVLSDGVGLLAGLQATGDLPGVTVLPGQAGSAGATEGTAMLEIVYDLAPAAQLYFATGFVSEASMANNIINLASQGCDVIVDDVGQLASPVFQDGIVAQAVDQVTAQGVLYFSSAANSGNLSSSTAGTWEGNFVAGGTINLGDAFGTLNNFGGAATNQLISTQGYRITLQWSDPWGGSANDYDLCGLNAAETQILACSTNEQNGDDNPLEQLPPNPPVGMKLVVVNFANLAAPRFLHLSTNRGRLQFGTSGETNGHSAAAGAFSVAAVNVATAGGGAFVGGAANPVENFSSDGPRRIFFNANGSAITPGNFLSTGGTLRQKPDIAAADAVSTASSPPGGNYNPFFGTSAAAPHAAAIAALMLDANPSATPSQVRQAFASTALDIMASGIDRDSGYGLIDAVDAIDAVTTGGGPCVQGPTTLCLLGDRFEVKATYTDYGNNTGAGHAVELTPDSGYFWFFDASNVEAVGKVVSFCPINGSFGFYAGGLTDVGVVMTVRDTVANQTQTFTNNRGHNFNMISSAFNTCQSSALPQAPDEEVASGHSSGDDGILASAGQATEIAALMKEAASSARFHSTEQALAASLPVFDAASAGDSRIVSTIPCSSNATTLCLLGDRFEVKATYTDYGNNTGSGHAVELTPDSGYFWFFDASNVEAVGKVVSFCPVNGSFGFYAGGLTDVGVVMTVRDTVANQTQTFTNNRGHNFNMISSAFNTCQ